MQEKKTRTKNINFSIYPEQIEYLRQYAEYTGLGNSSAALRLIITEHKREHQNGDNGDKQQETAA